MSKTKMILAVIGGIIALAFLGMACLVWFSYPAKTAASQGDDEANVEGLEPITEKAESLMRKSICPSAASVAAIDSNRTALVNWKTEALALACRGDRVLPATTEAAFKAFLSREAARLATLPTNGARVVKADFGFGPFQAYIAGGQMPKAAELPRLQRQWDDLATMIELLASNHVGEVTGIEIPVVAEPAPDKKKSRKKKEVEEKKGPSTETYVLTLTCKPSGFVKALNLLETCPRFVVVKNFSFTRAGDPIADALAGEKAKDVATPSRRRRRRENVPEEPLAVVAETEKGGLITDPMTEAPLTATLTVATFDFGLQTAADEKKEDNE